MSLALRSKPAHGAPCNACGQCCIYVPCPLSQHVYGQSISPCPALMQGEDRALICGLVADPRSIVPALTQRHGAGAVSRAAGTLIGAGGGCDAAVEGEKIDQEFRARLSATPAGIEVMVARHIFGIPEPGPFR